jgi:surfactin synthase thioesterase subunit
VCFPHAGGAASAFFALSAALSPAIAVHCVQYPGRQDRSREDPATDLTALADAIAAQLLVRFGPAERPALLGHSMGSLIAYETARRMEHAGRGPSVLFVSAHRAPADSALTSAVNALDDASLASELARLSGTDPAVLADETLMELILPAMRADYTALAGYRHLPGPPLTCPVMALLGDADPEVSPSQAGLWADYTTSTFAMRVFPGNHFYFDPDPDALAAVVRTTLTGGPCRG